MPDDVYELTEAGRAAIAADPVRLLRALAAELDERAEVHRRAEIRCGPGCFSAHHARADELEHLAAEYRTRALQALNAAPKEGTR